MSNPTRPHHAGVNDPPPINVIAAIQPNAALADAPQLVYPFLVAAVAKHAPFQDARLRRLQAAEPGSLNWVRWHDEVTRFEFIQTALRLQTAEAAERELLSAALTRLSATLFGAPNVADARELLAREILQTEQSMRQVALGPADAAAAERLLAAYRAQYGNESLLQPNAERLANAAALISDTRTYLYEHYGAALDAVTQGSRLDAEYEPPAVAARFRRGLAELCVTQPVWKQWRVVMHGDSGLGVNVYTRRAFVGKRRLPLLGRQLAPSFGHELLVHALRSVRAAERGDAQAAIGLPGYGRVEEGLGCLVEYALGGDPLEKMRDRYLDIALALGLFGQPPLARPQLFRLVLARLTLRAQAASKAVNTATLAEQAWRHVNRIYRGSRGDDAVGVCTKDASYYSGVRTIAQFIITARRHASAAAVYDYVLAGKFDPLDHAHALHLAAQGITLTDAEPSAEMINA